MSKIVKGENIKNSADESLKENTIDLLKESKEKTYYVVTDEDGNIKGYFPLKSKNLGRDWVAMYQSALKTLAKWNLPNEQYRVMLELLSETDFDNYIRISQSQLAEELDMKQSSVARAIKALKEKNVIVEGPRAGLNKTYRLNPYIAHKGANRTATILDFGDALEKSGKRMTDANIDLY